VARSFTFDDLAWDRPRGRPAGVAKPKSPIERKRTQRGRDKAARMEDIAVLDFETDPFDNVSRESVFPFMGVLYSDNFAPKVFWNENHEELIREVIAAIAALPRKYTIYAHNGGKFDYMYFMHLLRGRVSFKGRGLMAAKIGEHELRDSLHIIPTKLAAYKKDDFDYKFLFKTVRHKHRQAIIDYCISDCRNLLSIVKSFINRFGFKISVGQAAMAELKRYYKVGTLGPTMDHDLREYFYGGRVECIMGKGRFTGPYKLYDVNSMYPFVMAHMKHPISREYTFRRGKPNDHTAFVKVRCTNYGAFVGRLENGETSANIRDGVFNVSIHEYKAALELGLVENVEHILSIDCEEFSTFDKFVIPRYAERQNTKLKIEALEQAGLTESAEYDETVKDDLFIKLMLNNAYGKFAQNPRRFKEYYITDPNEAPPMEDEKYDEFTGQSWGDFPEFENGRYAIWSRPIAEVRFNNVGTAASITGAARSVLLRALHVAVDPIYCDTDSIICRALAADHDVSRLGAWKLEAEFRDVLIAGKKLYATESVTGKQKIKSKGANGLRWGDLEAILQGELISMINNAPTLTRRGTQAYIERGIRATASASPSLFQQSRMIAHER